MPNGTLVFRGLIFVMAIGIFSGCAQQRPVTGSHGSSGSRYEIVYQPKVQPEATVSGEARVVYSVPFVHPFYAQLFFDGGSQSIVDGRKIRTITVYDDRVEVSHGNDLISPNSTLTLSVHDFFVYKIAVNYDKNSGFYLIPLKNRGTLAFWELPDAQKVADGLFLLQQQYKDVFNKKLARFEPVAAEYRLSKTKPRMPEEQRKLVVQADASREKREYAKAIEQYQKAIEADPVAYPGAYNNLALLSAQVDQFYQAVFYMKHYLLLVPGDKDARASQDKIYEWEGMLQK
jgi:hypothetical protein